MAPSSVRSGRRPSRLRLPPRHDDGKESVLYELRPHRVALGDISPETLLQTIRAVPGWEAEP